MSSPSPLETADTIQLTSWMSRVVLRPAEPEDREALDKLADLDNAAPSATRPSPRGGRAPAGRTLPA